MSEVDLAAFQAKHPKLDPARVNLQALYPTPWSKNGKAN
jgi:hypothetical protein